MVQPRELYWASILLKQVWPHAGRSEMDVGALEAEVNDDVVVTFAVAVADEQYALSNAITVLATSGPQAPFEQSRIP